MRIEKSADFASNENGAISVVLALVALGGLTTGLALIGLMHHWRQLAEHQLRLDRCVGHLAQTLTRTQNEIEALNSRLRELRAAGGVTAMIPGANQTEAAAEAAIAVTQDALIARGDAQSVIYAVPGSCGNLGDWIAPPPFLKWFRPPPDELGPQPLQWRGDESLQILRAHRPRFAAAQIKGVADGWGSKWHAKWCPAGGK